MSQSPVPQEQPAPSKQQVTGVFWWPQERVVEIKTRPPLAIYDQSCVIPFEVVEVLFSTLLQLSLAARGIQAQMQPVGPPSKGPQA